MAELVDLLVPPGYRGVTSNMLFEWQKEQGASSMMWNEGESGDGRVCFFDIPVAAVNICGSVTFRATLAPVIHFGGGRCPRGRPMIWQRGYTAPDGRATLRSARMRTVWVRSRVSNEKQKATREIVANDSRSRDDVLPT
jgi:hypothetical protein